MPCDKNKGGRPPTVWQSLVDRDHEIRQLAHKGHTRTETAKIMGVSRNIMGEYWNLNGIERNTYQVNFTKENSTPKNLAILDKLDKKFRSGIYRRYTLFDDPPIDDGPRRKHKPKASSNRAGIHASDISSQLNLAKLEALRTFAPRHGSGAAFRTYAHKVFFNAMRQLERDAAKEARKRNQSGVDSSDDELIGMGIEDTIIMDEDGEIVRVESNRVQSGYAEARKQAHREASYDYTWNEKDKTYYKSPRLKDRRVFYCLRCHVHYVPRQLHKAEPFNGNLYSCPVCFRRDVINTGMTETRLSLNALSAKEIESRRAWNRFLGNTYNNVEGVTSHSQHTHAEMEGEKYDATGKVCAGEIGVARRVRWQGPVYCARKLLRDIAKSDQPDSQWVHPLSNAYFKQVHSVSYRVAS